MADQAITALPKKTYSGSSQIASTDYLLGIDSAEGYQMLIQDLGEYIINRATASLAGSTQTLASAISALNSNSYLLVGGTAIPENANINTYSTPGNYGCTSSVTARTMSGLPYASGSTNNFAFNLKVENAALSEPNTRRQVLQFFNDRQKWIRYGSISGGSVSWNDWEREPSRAEMDSALKCTTMTSDSNSNLVKVVETAGNYILSWNYPEDASAYYFAFVHKASGANPVINVIANNKLSHGAVNTVGTIVTNYNNNGVSGVVCNAYYLG